MRRLELTLDDWRQLCFLASIVEGFEQILQANPEAAQLARDLCRFFDGRLTCEIVPDDGKCSRFKLTGVTSSTEIGDVGGVVTVRRNRRLEEAVVHELLHANLIALGYPTFFLSNQFEFFWNRGENILNLAAHEVMLPTFLALGYDEKKFVGSCDLKEDGQEVVRELKAMDLSTPESFAARMLEYLPRWKVKVEGPIWLAKIMKARRALPR